MKYSEVQQMRKTAAPKYTLQRGDNPAILDRRFGFKPGTVAGLNPGLDYNHLQVGQQLNMPAGWSPQAPSDTGASAYHIIVSGDTMQGLDRHYGFPIGSFERANPGLNYRRLKVGQRVRMPVVRPAAPAHAATPARPAPQSQRPASRPQSQPQRTPEQAPGRQPFIGPSDYNLHGAMMQESLNGRYTQGDVRNGRAYAQGLLQIREVFPSERAAYERGRRGRPMTYVPVIDDVNDHYGTSYTAADRNNPVKSQEIYRLYLQRYGRAFYNRYGRNPTDEEYWRMWNGGPRGYTRPSTLQYVQAIRAKYANPGKWGLTPGVLYKPTGQ